MSRWGTPAVMSFINNKILLGIDSNLELNTPEPNVRFVITMQYASFSPTETELSVLYPGSPSVIKRPQQMFNVGLFANYNPMRSGIANLGGTSGDWIIDVTSLCGLMLTTNKDAQPGRRPTAVGCGAISLGCDARPPPPHGGRR